MRDNRLGERFCRLLAAPLPSLEIDADDGALAAPADVVDRNGVVLVGETHGVAENAAVLLWLVRELGPVQLGLEWNASASDALWRYANGGSFKMSELRPSADGRITPQHFSGVRQLCEEGLVGVVPLVPEEIAGRPDDHSQNVWEQAMAAQLLAGREPNLPMVAAMGSVHALVDPQAIRGPTATSVGRMFANHPGFEHRDVFYPTGWHVAQVTPVSLVRVRYGSGTYSNFGVKRFSVDRAIAWDRLSFRSGVLNVDLATATAAAVPDDN